MICASDSGAGAGSGGGGGAGSGSGSGGGGAGSATTTVVVGGLIGCVAAVSGSGPFFAHAPNISEQTIDETKMTTSGLDIGIWLLTFGPVPEMRAQTLRTNV